MLQLCMFIEFVSNFVLCYELRQCLHRKWNIIILRSLTLSTSCGPRNQRSQVQSLNINAAWLRLLTDTIHGPTTLFPHYETPLCHTTPRLVTGLTLSLSLSLETCARVLLCSPLLSGVNHSRFVSWDSEASNKQMCSGGYLNTPFHVHRLFVGCSIALRDT
jgi:hypothetical protein